MNVELREITAETVLQITRLTVHESQQQFVAPNAVSLAQALFSEEAWYRAIYAGGKPTGFAMLYDESLRAQPPEMPKVMLWRFMIGAEHQGKGIGAAALQYIIDHVRQKGVCRSLLVSYVPGPGSPEAFYLQAGFKHTGEIEDGEIVLELPL